MYNHPKVISVLKSSKTHLLSFFYRYLNRSDNKIYQPNKKDSSTQTIEPTSFIASLSDKLLQNNFYHAENKKQNKVSRSINFLSEAFSQNDSWITPTQENQRTEASQYLPNTFEVISASFFLILAFHLLLPKR